MALWRRQAALGRAFGIVLPALVFAGFTGCGRCGGSDEGPGKPNVFVGEVPADLINASWPLAFAIKAAQDEMTNASGGWVPLIVNRNYKQAVEKLGASGGLAAARGHAEAAALYRQAALGAAYSFVQTYATTPYETDPIEVAHLLTVSYAILGDRDAARAQSKRLEGQEGPTAAWHQPWRDWLASEAKWPPDLSKLPIELPPRAAGTWPEATGLPHYSLVEQSELKSAIDMGDPGALVALALWHESTAKAAAGEQTAQVDTYLARYRWPVEAEGAVAPLSKEFLFGSDFLVADDGPFIAALLGDKGASAVDEWKAKSLVAALADRARKDGHLDPQRALDLAAQLRETLVQSAREKALGMDDVAHRTFADIAEVAVLRDLALLAEAEGNRETSGILRINAMDKSQNATRCPTALLALAAWNASNRNPSPVTLDLVRETTRRYPSVEIARYGFDVLALRVSRERPTQGGAN